MDKIFEDLSTLENKKLKISNIITERYKDMNENPEFEQNYYSRTAEGNYKLGQDIIRLMNWLAHYDRSYHVIINYYDLMGFVLKYSNETS